MDEAMRVQLVRRLVDGLVQGAWRRRNQVRLVDALYVELASLLGVPLLTTDVALGRAAHLTDVVEVIAT